MPRSLIPNSTQVPDVIIDRWMAELSGNEFKVLLYVARRTYGFGKDADTISLNQISRGLTKRDGTVLDRGTGASRSGVAAALKSLEERGLILRTNNRTDTGREYEESTYRINLDCEPPEPEDNQGGQNEPGAQGSSGGKTKYDPPVAKQKPPSKNRGGVVQKLDYLVQKLDGGWSKNWTTVVQKLDQQETDLQETDQETAAAKAQAPPDGPVAAAADFSLVEELVLHGVGRSVATQLAKEKPELCRRYLEYLPFAEVKTTEGAWLTNAIRNEFGPPAGYVKVQKAQTALAANTADDAKAAQSPYAARYVTVFAQLRQTYSQLEKMQPEAIRAFESHLAIERDRTEKFARRLSLRRGEQELSHLATEEYRLEQFGKWLRTRDAPLASGVPSG